MRKHYDFSNAVRNPHAGKFKDGYTIIVEHKDYNEVITITKSRKPKEGSVSVGVAGSIASQSNT